MYETIINHLRKQGGIFTISEQDKKVYIWEQDVRLIKPVTAVFLKGLEKHFSFQLTLKNEQK